MNKKSDNDDDDDDDYNDDDDDDLSQNFSSLSTFGPESKRRLWKASELFTLNTLIDAQ